MILPQVILITAHASLSAARIILFQLGGLNIVVTCVGCGWLRRQMLRFVRMMERRRRKRVARREARRAARREEKRLARPCDYK